MKSTTAWLAGLIWVSLCTVAAAGDLRASDALLPRGLVMAEGYLAGTGAAVGRLASVTGEAVIVHGDDLRGYRGEAGCGLYPNDLVVTRERARADIELNDGSRIAMAAQTRLVIDKSVYEPAEERRESLFGMTLGKARFLVRKLAGAARSDFRVKTATAIAGVRGSDFVVEAAPEMTEVTALQDTRLEVAGLAEPARVVELTDYQRTRVAAGEAPGTPEAVPRAEIDRLLQDLPLKLDTERSGDASEGSAEDRAAAAAGNPAVIPVAVEKPTAVVAGADAQAAPEASKGEGAAVSGSLINITEIKNVHNEASGSGSQANVGAIVVE